MNPSRRVAILVEDQYQVLEVWYPYYRLQEEGYEVVLVGTGTKTQYASKEGYPVSAHLSVDQLQACDYDAVIIPGGWAPDFLRRSQAMVSFVRELNSQKKIVAAICHGGWMLVSAGILRGKRATSFFAIRDDLIAAGACFEDREVVVDGNLITARKPDDLPCFVRTIIQHLPRSYAES